MFDVPEPHGFFNVDSKAVRFLDRTSLADSRGANSRFPVHQRRRRPRNPYSQIRRSFGIPHHAEQEIERANSRVFRSRRKGSLLEDRALVGRALLAATAPFTWFGSSVHRSFVLLS